MIKVMRLFLLITTIGISFFSSAGST
ncbi:type 1 fimbrial protein, partial [Proteus sp. G4378]|nr:type 1 fimbrial protein [Proteus sp. G4378]